MARYMLDTNHLSPMVTLSHPLRTKILHQVQQQDSFHISTLVYAEMLYGIGILPRAKQNIEEWEKLSPIFERLSFTESEAKQAAELQIDLRKQGWQLQLVDALITVTALRHNLILLTADKDFNPISGLTTENWLVDKTAPQNDSADANKDKKAAT